MARSKDIELEKSRKAEILSAASRCFVRAGLHQASMRQICAEAKLSAGAVYNYFASKEAIIEGLADAERAEITELAEYLNGQENCFKAIVQTARWIVEETSPEEMQLQLEMAAEAGRNERIRTLIQQNGDALHACLLDAAHRGQTANQITRAETAEALTDYVTALYEGFLGRATFTDDKQRKAYAVRTEKAVARLLAP